MASYENAKRLIGYWVRWGSLPNPWSGANEQLGKANLPRPELQGYQRKRS